MIILFIIAIIIALFILKLIILSLFFYPEIKAAQERDPAAYSFFEILFMYQGLSALYHYRIANFFYKIKVEFLARLISQYSRFVTGIEILSRLLGTQNDDVFISIITIQHLEI